MQATNTQFDIGELDHQPLILDCGQEVFLHSIGNLTQTLMLIDVLVVTEF
jgi:hypothetical protein